MFCPNCGTKVDDGVAFCPSCGSQINNAATSNPSDVPPAQNNVYQQEAPAQDPIQPVAYVQDSTSTSTGTTPPDYLTINIVLTAISVFVCCFSCLSLAGIVTGAIGIVFSTQVRKAVQAQDWALAEQKSKTAKTMWIVTAVLLGISVLFGIIGMATGMLAGMSEAILEGYY